MYPLFGYGWQIDGRPITESDVERSIIRQAAIMTGLDLIDDSNRRAWTIGPSAWTLLPRTTMLVDMPTDEK